MEVCFATNNNHKIEEMSAILGSSFSLRGLADIGCFEELPETQHTIQENSLQKARYVFDKYHVPCFADDTGLEVDALQGAPGVHSARYAGPEKKSDENITLLLKNLQNSSDRKAQFRTVITWVDSSGEKFFEGIVRGQILFEKKGSKGFGYDAVFQAEGYSKSFAEMSLDEKNAISHRAIAVRKLAEYLKQTYGS